VLAWGYLDQHHADDDGDFDPDYSDADAAAALDAYVDRVIDPSAGIDVRRRTECSLAARALLEAASGASLLVLGAKRQSALRGLLVGSVSQHCLHHATSPLAIVHPRAAPAEGVAERVVVGIDGSDTSRAALRWAVGEARLRQASLDVVLAWHLPYVGGYPYTGASFDPGYLEEGARTTLDEFVDGTDTTGLPRPPDRILSLGDPASALVDIADGADLVVVGSRGLGGFTGLLLGSVSHHVAHHAPCPVVIIPPEG
jgi:nucleotide-binding universal stress UspA family protein